MISCFAINDKYLYKLSHPMKTYSEFVLECSQLKESSLSRIKSKSDKGGMAVLSATRSEKSAKENKERNKQLDKDIRGRGLPGPTKTKGKWEGGSERSHVVSSGKKGKRKFKKEIKKLGKKYDQDAVIVQTKKNATLSATRKGGLGNKKRVGIGKFKPQGKSPDCLLYTSPSPRD